MWGLCILQRNAAREDRSFCTVLNISSPDIQEEGSSSDVIVREGANVTLTCKAVGYPTPNITWRREDNEPIPLGAWQGKEIHR
ncbi:lachesin [Caerostris extrusa]|uniref:Lachesin n=1 Tax=Caerostris extrusa TaxID=172846 RepID=A0AAV4VQN7_CAEEX|nr:lachesin [Caerostris extrusa]